MTPARKTVTLSPENSETPAQGFATWATPNRLFFVRNHFEVPACDPVTWVLTLDGLVQRPSRWTLSALAAMPQHAVFATVECAGNGRSFLQEKTAGVQWGAGAIGHAEWTGVRLRDLLHAAGLHDEAREVVFEGADSGTEPDHPAPMNFSRSLPLAKALHPDTLIALQMNGEPLDANHGAPMRLFVPGWYGVASVKWLRRMHVIDHVYQGYFQTTKYTVDRMTPEGKRRVPVGASVVKSEILQPAEGATLGVGPNRIAGIAWAGEERVSHVDVSTDGGDTWNRAELTSEAKPYAWCRWEFVWNAATAGDFSLMARAHSASGQAQPFDYDRDNLGYLVNVVLPRRVHVASDRDASEFFANPEPWIETMLAHAESNRRRPLDIELSLTGGDGI